MRNELWLALGLLISSVSATHAAQRVIEPGQPPVIVHPTVQATDAARARSPGDTARAPLLSYHGGNYGRGVEVAPRIYLVLWGRQWKHGDPSGESALLQRFLSGAGGSSWLNSVTQYCEGVAAGTVFCRGAGIPAGNQPGMLAGVWSDDDQAAPKHPLQSQMAAEAFAAAQHFGNTTAPSNANAQYVIATSHGHNSTGFGTQYCAYHSWTASAAGALAYTNLPYITDSPGACGANFNGLGFQAGITIVEGHELAETITDPFPLTGWFDNSNQENGDKCVWIHSGQGAAADTTFTTGVFAVQSLWSNAYDNDKGGCVLSF